MSQPAFSALSPLPFEIIYEDGELLESDWHVKQGPLLDEGIVRAMQAQNRTDFHVGVNQGVYYSVEQAREVHDEETKGLPKKAFRGPDLFWIGGVSNHLRTAWISWEEGGRLPEVIVELLSPKTAKIDRTVKKDLYAQVFGTSEYFLVDPSTRRVEGFDLVGGVYQPKTPTTQGRLWCRQFDAYLGFRHGVRFRVEGDWVRLFDRDGNLLLTGEEEAEAERGRAEAERRQRLEAEAELARVRARLKEAGLE
ncbi:MAG TPA: Uma2 family endonuclease [Thermoanaerobaculia bacterium]|jgi:Uma2 family endonuclease|nr:Uma2 family endonuclease [Thermoanaerobaculia bacterium]